MVRPDPEDVTRVSNKRIHAPKTVGTRTRRVSTSTSRSAVARSTCRGEIRYAVARGGQNPELCYTTARTAGTRRTAPEIAQLTTAANTRVSRNFGTGAASSGCSTATAPTMTGACTR